MKKPHDMTFKRQGARLVRTHVAVPEIDLSLRKAWKQLFHVPQKV